MTTHHPGDGDEPAAAAAAGPRRRWFVVFGLVAVALVAVTGLVVGALVLLVPQADQSDPLSADAPGLTSFDVRPTGCTFEPERGGMVAHFMVRTNVAGRFTVDVEAVTDEGADDLDIDTQHVVRYTARSTGGRRGGSSDVVVPLSEEEHRDGYRQCL